MSSGHLSLITSSSEERLAQAQLVEPNTPDGYESCNFIHCRRQHRDVLGKDGVGVVRVHCKDPELAGYLRMYGDQIIFLHPDDPEPDHLHPAYRKVYFLD